MNVSAHSRSREVQVLRGGPLVWVWVAMAACLLAVATIWVIANGYLQAPVTAALGGLLLLTLALVLLGRIQRIELRGSTLTTHWLGRQRTIEASDIWSVEPVASGVFQAPAVTHRNGHRTLLQLGDTPGHIRMICDAITAWAATHGGTTSLPAEARPSQVAKLPDLSFHANFLRMRWTMLPTTLLALAALTYAALTRQSGPALAMIGATTVAAFATMIAAHLLYRREQHRGEQHRGEQH